MSRCWLLVGHKKNVSGVQFVFAHVCPGSCPLWGGATTVGRCRTQHFGSSAFPSVKCPVLAQNPISYSHLSLPCSPSYVSSVMPSPHFLLSLMSINTPPSWHGCQLCLSISRKGRRGQTGDDARTVLIKGLNTESITFSNSFPAPFLFACLRRCK